MTNEDRFIQAQELLKSRKYSKASIAFQKILVDDAANPNIHIGLAKCLFALKDYRPAMEASQRAIELNPYLSEPHRIIAYIHWKEKEYKQSEVEFKLAIQKEPTSAPLHIELGKILFFLGRFEESIASFENALNISPSDHKVKFHLAYAYIRNGEYPEGKRELLEIWGQKKSFMIGFSLIQAYVTKNKVVFAALGCILTLVALLFPTVYTIPMISIVIIYYLGMAARYFLLKHFVLGITTTLVGFLLFALYLNAFFN